MLDHSRVGDVLKNSPHQLGVEPGRVHAQPIDIAFGKLASAGCSPCFYILPGNRAPAHSNKKSPLFGGDLVSDERVEVQKKLGINTAVGDNERSAEREDKCIFSNTHNGNVSRQKDASDSRQFPV